MTYTSIHQDTIEAKPQVHAPISVTSLPTNPNEKLRIVMRRRGMIRSAQAAAIIALLDKRAFCKIGNWGVSLWIRQLPLS